MLLGCIASCGNGILMPLFSLKFGQVLDDFGAASMGGLKDLAGEVRGLCIYFTYLMAATFVASYLMIVCFMASSIRQANRIRHMTMAHILRQEVGWFEATNSGALLQGIGTDIQLIQVGLSEKLGLFCQGLALSISGVTIGMWKNYRLALVVSTVGQTLWGKLLTCASLRYLPPPAYHPSRTGLRPGPPDGICWVRPGRDGSKVHSTVQRLIHVGQYAGHRDSLVHPDRALPTDGRRGCNQVQGAPQSPLQGGCAAVPKQRCHVWPV